MRRVAPSCLPFRCWRRRARRSRPAGVPIDGQLQRARAEQAAAEKEAARLDKAASEARGEADRLRAEQAAAAQAMDAAEARITAADMQLRLASAYVAAHRQQLAGEQRPVSSLLAGLAVMARARRCWRLPTAAAPTNWSRCGSCWTRPCP